MRGRWKGKKQKKVSANNNQPDDGHGGEVGLRDRDASEATARERHARRTLHFALVAMQPAKSNLTGPSVVAVGPVDDPERNLGHAVSGNVPRPT